VTTAHESVHLLPTATHGQWLLVVDQASRNAAITTCKLVADVCDTRPGDLPAREKVFARLLPDYSATDPITALEMRLKHDKTVLTTFTNRAHRSLRLVAANAPIYNSAALSDLAATLVAGNLILAERGNFAGKPRSAIIKLQAATTVPHVQRYAHTWLVNDAIITVICLHQLHPASVDGSAARTR